jgi:hypothetical protein
MGWTAEVTGDPPVFFPDLHNLADAIRSEHPLQRLLGEIVAAGAAEAGRDHDFAANRRNELTGTDLELRTVRATLRAAGWLLNGGRSGTDRDRDYGNCHERRITRGFNGWSGDHGRSRRRRGGMREEGAIRSGERCTIPTENPLPRRINRRQP